MGLYFNDGTDFDSAGNKFAVQYAITSNITCNSSGGTVYLQGNNLYSNGNNGGPGGNFASGFSIGNSSGYVTFPSTGLYYLSFSVDGITTSTNVRSQTPTIFFTNNNGSSQTTLAQKSTFIHRPTGTTTLNECSVDALVDITDVSNQKVRFGCQPDNIGTYFLQGSGSIVLTCFTIIRVRGT